MTGDGPDDGEEFVADRDDVADIIEEAEPSAAPERTGSDDTSAEEEGAVAGSITPEVPVTPEMPTLENTAFVALGVYLTLLVFADAIVGLSPTLVVVTLVVIGLVTAACYGVLVWTIPDT